ncbi:hypothetical protein MJO28_012026 [Puccinia striiformis f. sp. tritici]|uniref:Uncharacterized protein n=1 Tax=Puccinia striiformis f. sp. tritici TaxID=168172 RepID=A0ACC0E0P5_9BASI|nr:hypothetical protein MJO28_012026 [Puccinia striiformis f. sp. tritici]
MYWDQCRASGRYNVALEPEDFENASHVGGLGIYAGESIHPDSGDWVVFPDHKESHQIFREWGFDTEVSRRVWTRDRLDLRCAALRF